MLKPFMAYNRHEGPSEGASLVLAPNARAAKPLAWRYSGEWYDDYTDLAVRLIRDGSDVLPLADQSKLAAGEPHVIDDPLSCQCCGQWGAGLTVDDLCGWCNCPPGDALVRKLKGNYNPLSQQPPPEEGGLSLTPKA